MTAKHNLLTVMKSKGIYAEHLSDHLSGTLWHFDDFAAAGVGQEFQILGVRLLLAPKVVSHMILKGLLFRPVDEYVWIEWMNEWIIPTWMNFKVTITDFTVH